MRIDALTVYLYVALVELNHVLVQPVKMVSFVIYGLHFPVKNLRSGLR